MVKEITMPQLAQTTDEVKLIKWLVEEGADVKRGQALCEVETDKTNMELESFENGSVLKLLAEPGQIIPAGQVIAIIGEKSEKIPEDVFISKDLSADMQKPKKEPKSTVIEPKPTGNGGFLKEPNSNNRQNFVNEEFKATAIVKNIAKIKNIDLRLIKGTGPQGIIIKEDLERFAKEGPQQELSDEYILSKNQQAVARNLAISKSQIPHYYIKTNIYADPVLNWRENNSISGNSSLGSNSSMGSKISIYAVLVFAAADALKKFPKLNGYFKENKIILRKKINIGFAVGQGEELFVPVIKNADTKSIFVIDKEVKSLVAKTVSGRFDEGDLSEGTFTITNLGMYDVDEFSAIINPPQACILAVGKIKKTLHVDELEKIGIRNEFTITGSFDHRIVNGKSGAQFLQEFKKIIEEKIT
ncbi:MAG: dihydrolipoamide acetyltransferase family protein [Candidatus Humimicrobiaceae bacterium]